MMWSLAYGRVVTRRTLLLPCSRFSTTTNHRLAVPKAVLDRLRQRWQSPRWRRLAALLRYTRIPLLILGVYQLGYQQGVMECIKRPLSLQDQILTSILSSMGARRDQVTVVEEGFIVPISPSPHHQVAAIGHRIVSAARDYVEAELQAAMNSVKANLPEDIDEAAALAYYQAHPDVQYWQEARLRLEGEQRHSRAWQYIFIDSRAANAFVTEILPQRFFITSAMLDVATTEHELAMVLGHEVSHLILGHVSSTNYYESLLRTLEIVLLSLDPTSGGLALVVIAGLATARHALSSAHSRESEYQADQLGLILAARACFDTKAGAEVMRKMNALKIAAQPELAGRTSSVMNQVLDTHPPSLERYERLLEQASREQATNYRACQSLTKRFYQSLWQQQQQQQR